MYESQGFWAFAILFYWLIEAIKFGVMCVGVWFIAKWIFKSLGINISLEK